MAVAEQPRLLEVPADAPGIEAMGVRVVDSPYTGTMTAAYVAGYEAAWRGASAEHNPWAGETHRAPGWAKAWREGWELAVGEGAGWQ